MIYVQVVAILGIHNFEYHNLLYFHRFECCHALWNRHDGTLAWSISGIEVDQPAPKKQKSKQTTKLDLICLIDQAWTGKFVRICLVGRFIFQFSGYLTNLVKFYG